jgi:hypothetical protein
MGAIATPSCPHRILVPVLECLRSANRSSLCSCKDALLDYLRTSGRWGTMDTETPLWTSHDRTRLRIGDQLTGHAFAKRVKMYARWAGPAPDASHAARARWVSESTGSIIAQARRDDEGLRAAGCGPVELDERSSQAHRPDVLREDERSRRTDAVMACQSC